MSRSSHTKRSLISQASPTDHTLDHLSEVLIALAASTSPGHPSDTLIGPDLKRLREAIEHDDPDWGRDALSTARKQIDPPQQ
jgi:hypothetical protein